MRLEPLEARRLLTASVLYRINAGGDALTDNPSWDADSSVSPSSYRISGAAGTYVTASPIDLSHPSIPAGTPAALFQTERPDAAGGDEMRWQFPVEPGTYEVRLHFAEIYSGALSRGARTFDVRVENQLWLDDYDVFAEVGGYAGVTKSRLVTSDALLDIEFLHVRENPAIKAIEVLAQQLEEDARTYRVNAGGAALAGRPNWRADSSVAPSSHRVSGAAGTFATSSPIDLSHPSIPAGTPAALFQTERPDGPGGDEMRWQFPVQPGPYEVRLYFAEIYAGALRRGARLFDVRIEDQLVLDNYDVFAEVGGFAGVTKSFVVIADAQLEIEFLHVRENPAIKAIEILPAESVQEENLAPSLSVEQIITLEELAVQELTVVTSDPNGDTVILAMESPPPFVALVEEAESPTRLRVAPASGDAGEYSFQLIATDSAQPPLTTTQTIELQVAAAPRDLGAVRYRVNAGGTHLAGNPSWQADSPGSPSAYRVSGALGAYDSSSPIDVSHPSLPAGTPAALFQSERPDAAGGEEMRWHFPVQQGEYEVRLYFAEIYRGALRRGARVFDVSIEDQLVLDDYDVFADVGGYTGVMKSFYVTADTRLDIEFLHVRENPAIKAIEIVGPQGKSNDESQDVAASLVTGSDGNLYRAVRPDADQIDPVGDLLERHWQLAAINNPTQWTVLAGGQGREDFEYLWGRLQSVTVAAELTIRFESPQYTFDHTINLRHNDGARIELVGTGDTELLFTNRAGRPATEGFHLLSDGVIKKLDGFVIRGQYQPWDQFNPDAPGSSQARIHPQGTPLRQRSHGIWARDGGVIHLGPDILVTNFYYGIAAERGGIVYADHTEVHFGGDANYFAYDGGVIYAHGARSIGAADAKAQAGHTAAGVPLFDSWGHGFVAETVVFTSPRKNARHAITGYSEAERSRIYAENSESAHHLIAGYFANLGGRIHAQGSRAHSNFAATNLPNKSVVGVGYWSNLGSILEVSGAEAYGNITGFFAQESSVIDAKSAFAWNNHYAGYLAYAGSEILSDGSRAFVVRGAETIGSQARQQVGWRYDHSSTINTSEAERSRKDLGDFCVDLSFDLYCPEACSDDHCTFHPNEIDVLID